MRLAMLVAALLGLGASYRYLVEGERASPGVALAAVAAVGWHWAFPHLCHPALERSPHYHIEGCPA
jgi:hypothetical protein